MLGDMSITSFCDFFSLFPLSIISPTPIIYNLGCWLGRPGPAKESTLAPYFPGVQCNKEVQVEGIAYSFCGLWISSVLACLCVTSQLNSTAPGSIPGGLSV